MVVEEVIEGAELLDETRPSDSTSMHCWPRRDALEAQVRRHERSWVDGSIPMFGGLTPRQALEAPPTLLTMEGEPAVFCTAEYAINDPDQAAAALHDRFEPDPDGRIFIDWVEVDGQRWGRGTLEV